MITTTSVALLGATERRTLLLSVDDVGVEGVSNLSATLVMPAEPAGELSALVCCFAGGGMSARYFELPGYDMAGHLAARRFGVLLVDHPGTGASDRPVDAWHLTPEVVADLDAAAVRTATDQLGLSVATVVGLGHSMGAMLAGYQQIRHRLYDCLVFVGYSGRGLPEVLDPDEAEVSGDPDRVGRRLVGLSQRRFRQPIIEAPTSTLEMLVGPNLPEGAASALASCAAGQLSVCAMATLLPGGHGADLAAIDVPVLFEIAEHDIVGPPQSTPTYLPSCPYTTVHVVRDAFHNSNVSPSREVMWDHIARWVQAGWPA